MSELAKSNLHEFALSDEASPLLHIHTYSILHQLCNVHFTYLQYLYKYTSTYTYLLWGFHTQKNLLMKCEIDADVNYCEKICKAKNILNLFYFVSFNFVLFRNHRVLI